MSNDAVRPEGMQICLTHSHNDELAIGAASTVPHTDNAWLGYPSYSQRTGWCTRFNGGTDLLTPRTVVGLYYHTEGGKMQLHALIQNKTGRGVMECTYLECTDLDGAQAFIFTDDGHKQVQLLTQAYSGLLRTKKRRQDGLAWEIVQGHPFSPLPDDPRLDHNTRLTLDRIVAQVRACWGQGDELFQKYTPRRPDPEDSP